MIGRIVETADDKRHIFLSRLYFISIASKDKINQKLTEMRL